jgi:hypothetical protein
VVVVVVVVGGVVTVVVGVVVVVVVVVVEVPSQGSSVTGAGAGGDVLPMSAIGLVRP